MAASLFSGWHGHTLAGLGSLLAVGLLATLAQLMLTRAYATGRMLLSMAACSTWGLRGPICMASCCSMTRSPFALLGMGLIALAGIAAVRLRPTFSASNRISTTL